MSDGNVEKARSQWAASLRESNARYRALLLANNAPADLIEELNSFDRPVDVDETQPAVPPHQEIPAGASLCHDLLLALNALRSQYVDRAATHAAPGIGQEAMAFLHVDEANHHQGLMVEIERLERAMMAAGCPI